MQNIDGLQIAFDVVQITLCNECIIMLGIAYDSIFRFLEMNFACLHKF